MPYKQVIVIRSDLKLSKGKLAAQVAHASLDSYKKADRQARESWENEGSKKIVLKAESLQQLLDLHEQAKKQKLPCTLIRDAGKTHVPSGTVTCLGIGPDREEKIDKVTGKLKLLG